MPQTDAYEPVIRDYPSCASPFVALLDAKDAAYYLSVSRGHFYALVSRGVIPPPLKLGRSARWSVAQLDSVIEKLSSAQA